MHTLKQSYNLCGYPVVAFYTCRNFWSVCCPSREGLRRNYRAPTIYSQGCLDKVDQSDYRKITIHSEKVSCQSQSK